MRRVSGPVLLQAMGGLECGRAETVQEGQRQDLCWGGVGRDAGVMDDAPSHVLTARAQGKGPMLYSLLGVAWPSFGPARYSDSDVYLQVAGEAMKLTPRPDPKV